MCCTRYNYDCKVITEYWTVNSACENANCFFKRIPDLKGKTRFKCAAKNCFKLNVLGESTKEIKEFSIKKVSKNENQLIKLKF
jgi:hypothetical protein